MEEHFNTFADESSHKEMADTMVKCREQLTYCAHNEFDMHSGSQELLDLREFNAKNMENVEGMSKYMLQKKAEMDEHGSSSGFETVEDYGSVIDEGSDEDMDDDEDKPKGKGKGKVVDDDGFEEVVDKKKRR